MFDMPLLQFLAIVCALCVAVPLIAGEVMHNPEKRDDEL